MFALFAGANDCHRKYIENQNLKSSMAKLAYIRLVNNHARFSRRKIGTGYLTNEKQILDR